MLSRPVVIVDFDDTLFPTSHYVASIENNMEVNMPELMIDTVERFLNTIDILGEVVFLTASCPDTQWMLGLVDTHFTRLASFFRSKRILYSRHHGSLHKLESFNEIIDLFGRERVYISVSDAPIDHFHFQIACMTDVSCKAIQFHPHPTIALLYHQLQCLTQHVSSLNVYDGGVSTFTVQTSPVCNLVNTL
jgi:hypothetical protein